jgi:two-component system sensor histidine kinase CpxA
MRSLFVKIFLAFFATVVLLGVLLELTAVRTELRRVNEVFRPIAERAAPRLADAYEQRGVEALSDELRRLPAAAALANDRGEAIGLMPASLAPAFEVLRKLPADPGERPSGFVAWRSFAVQPATSASGRHYYAVFQLPHERWSAILNTLDQYPAVRLTMVGLVAGVTCLLLARHITRPLVELRATAGRMADGHLDARAGFAVTNRRDEIGALGRDFDVMADRLGALVDSQRQLLADVSHELRSPLARLTVALGLARQHAVGSVADPRDRAILASDLDRIELEAARLDRLIGQSLTLARLDTGVEAGPHETFDLTNLVQQVAADGDYEARATGRRVSMSIADPCVVSGVADLVRSAVENVVRNAIKHTAPDTTVDLTLRRVKLPHGTLAASVQVRDHGPGIEDAALAVVFLPFRRGPARTGSATSSSGLGLAIVDRVIRLHGGAVSAVNAAGGGLLVEITLPVRLP